MVVTAAIWTHPPGAVATIPPFRASAATRTSPGAVPAGFEIAIDVAAVVTTVVDAPWKAMPPPGGGVGVPVPVGVAVGVGVRVGVAVGDGVAVGVGVPEGTGVAVGVDVAVAA
jgi:hypothetical protein